MTLHFQKKFKIVTPSFWISRQSHWVRVRLIKVPRSRWKQVEVVHASSGLITIRFSLLFTILAASSSHSLFSFCVFPNSFQLPNLRPPPQAYPSPSLRCTLEKKNKWKLLNSSPRIWGSLVREAEARGSGQSKTTSTKTCKAELRTPGQRPAGMGESHISISDVAKTPQ